MPILCSYQPKKHQQQRNVMRIIKLNVMFVQPSHCFWLNYYTEKRRWERERDRRYASTRGHGQCVTLPSERTHLRSRFVHILCHKSNGSNFNAFVRIVAQHLSNIKSEKEKKEERTEAGKHQPTVLDKAPCELFPLQLLKCQE